MINDLKYFKENRFQDVFLGMGVSHFMVNENGNYIEKYFRNNGVCWNYEGKQIFLFEENTTIQAYPDTNFNKLLLIYKQSEKYPPPSNAVIYNADGTVSIILSPPELIGMISQKHKEHDVLLGACFGGLYPSWYTNTKGEKVVGISILFPEQYRNLYGNFFEVREIDLETGYFGEVLQDGAV